MDPWCSRPFALDERSAMDHTAVVAVQDDEVVEPYFAAAAVAEDLRSQGSSVHRIAVDRGTLAAEQELKQASSMTLHLAAVAF